MSNVRMLNRCIFLGIVLILAAVPVSGRQILTEHEQSGYENYTSYENMMKFLLDIKAASTEMQLGIVGKTLLGREIPYAVFSRPAISKPWEALVSGKPVVVLAANIHGNERTLRESNMILIRELATKGTEMNKLLDDLVILMVPSINPDGFNAQPRATRGNALGVDLNRDYMKLEQPALVAYVQNIWHAWHPHIFVDGHNGGSYPYNINYHGPCVASADRRLELLCDREIYPFITKKMEENGYKAWYYSGGDREQWRVGSFDPRSGKNYAPFVNCISILFESPGSQDMETAAKSGLVAYKAVLQYVSQNADKVKMHVERARRETIEMGKSAAGDVVVQMKHVAEDYKVSYEIAEGRGEDRRIIKVTGAEIIKKPVETKTRPRPYAYILEDRAVEAIELLKRHNITIEVLQKDTELEIQVYTIDSVTYAPEYDHPAAATVHVADVVTRTMTFPKGSFVIQTGQVMGRVVAHLLEPETNDNVVKWNTMDYALPPPGSRVGGRVRELPIYKLMKPAALATKMLN